MRRRVVLVSVVLMLAMSPALVVAQPPAEPTPEPEPGQAPPPPTLPLQTTEPLAPTILSEPVPVIPSTVPPVEGAPPPPTISSAPLRLLPQLAPTGAARPVFVFQPSVSVREEYTDNFDLTKTNRHSNFRSTIAPTMLLSLDTGPTKGIVSYTLAANHDSFRDEFLYFHSVLGQVSWKVTPRLTFTVADTFTHNDDPREADSLGLRRQRSTFTGNTFSATADYLIDRVATRTYYRWNTFTDTTGEDTTAQTAGLSASIPLYVVNTLTLGYEYLNAQSSASSNQTSQGTSQTFQGTQDVQGHEITASLGRKLTSLLTAGVSGSYAFRNLSGSTTTNSGNFQLWNAAVFGTYGAGVLTPLTLTGKIGVTGVNSDSGDRQGPDLSLSGTASYAFAKAVVTLSAENGFSETFDTGQNFGVVKTTGATASFSYQFTPRTNGVVSASYRKTETTGIGGGQSLGANPSVSGGRNDNSEGVGLSAMFTIGLLRWLDLTLVYTYTQRFDNGAGTTSSTASSDTNAGYTENRVRVGFDVKF